jgi:hypothetical protein
MSPALRLALTTAGVFAIAALIPYLLMFQGGLSSASEEWSNFGGYIGGTLGPIFALLAFAVGVQAILDNRQQNVRQGLLTTIQRYEADFEAACVRTVSCEAPWIWGRTPSESHEIQRLSLRTLLYSDTVDWEQHLPPLIVGHGFQVLPTGEVSQDREVILAAQMAVEGLFKYLALYIAAGGDSALASYLQSRYEIAKNRIEIACHHAADSIHFDS